ncbi:glycine--tRNA ligase subunit beta [Halanaerobium praevalens]|uniref:Glycine--tRNA ligase beta subunit n=1 Tax=Halanaerobium praevalens (strain ATCC 33744 / DSM 2228 / GSL) TaxID=572479 RepID=E3DQ70_HALPG|nr:glycine--tRNA ligase subunit beta [Halanaerobium praevalens]ADO76821.1 glycyl-tRNA synthetase, beta subunit [Halanaerobium praevalens DSM 2228]
MAKNLIFEVGTEEMPAASMQRFREDYLQTAATIFENNNLEYEEINVYSTPRRLVLAIEALAEKQTDNKEIVRGPAVNIAFDADGNPTRAGEGFAKGQGLEVSDLTKKDGYLYAEKITKGQNTANILAGILTQLIKNVPLPKAMRWGSVKMEFIRPIKWLLALFGSEKIELELAGIKSSNYSIGHRFLSEGHLEIKEADAYFSTLENASVIVKQKQREEKIRKQIEKLDLSASALIKDSLLTEVIDLIEFPTAFKGSFDSSYLKLPAEVLITAMEKHQRYFPVVSQKGELKSEFIGVRDGGSDFIKEVISGNEMVLKGRLDDAQFFFAEDQKYGFLNRTENIKDIVFQKDIGSVYEKVQKLEKITANLADTLAYTAETKKMAKKAAKLAKNDLATEMVNEFSNLQGLMGKEYALLAGEAAETATAIFEHYLPRFAGDKLPETKSGTILAMAEKLFNLSSHFLLNNIPSGSQDPFALRRQATGLVRIILENKLEINIEQLIHSSMKIVAINLEQIDSTAAKLKEFILQRLENLLAEENIRYDIINAVIKVNNHNLFDLYQRAHKLMEFRNEDSKLFVDLVRGLVRVKNISEKAENKLEFDAGLLVENEEKKLYKDLKTRKTKIKELFSSAKYKKGLYLLVELKPAIDQFLDNVMVMVDDQKIKNNRLALLGSITPLVAKVIDIEEIALD